MYIRTEDKLNSKGLLRPFFHYVSQLSITLSYIKR